MAFALGFTCGILATLGVGLWLFERSASSRTRKRAVDPEAFSASGLAAPPRGTHGASYEETT